MHEEIRVLIVSNEALCDENSNSRTLLKLLTCVPASQIAQFCLHGKLQEGVCDGCFMMPDRDVVTSILHHRAFLKRRHIVRPVAEGKGTVNSAASQAKIPVRKSIRNKLFRDIAWRTYFWWTKEMDDFIKAFKPSVVLLQAGDAPFMYRIAIKIAKKHSLPLVVFNTENYVLKKYMYFGASKHKFWHWILKKRLQAAYKAVTKQTKTIVYLTDFLKQAHNKVYPAEAEVIYNSSDMKPLAPLAHEDFAITYIGNLGVGRHIPLMELADLLDREFPDVTLRIFGRFTNSEIQQRLCSHASVDYRGLIPYDQVPEEMSKSDLLLHCEGRSRLENLMGAFSTKIADSLNCGIPFLVYADRRYPFAQYLDEAKAAFVVGDEQEFSDILRRCLESDDYRKQNLERAAQLAAENHNAEKNSQKMLDILLRAVHSA